MDDGLGCSSSPEKAIQTLREARRLLATYNIRLHKIASNAREVLEAFPESEWAKESTQIRLDNTQIQRTLGVVWDINNDTFNFKTDVPSKPFTKRGVLATVNAIFDPIGPASPVVLGGKLIQRRIISPKLNDGPSDGSLGWDDPLPEELEKAWSAWKTSLDRLGLLAIPRSFRLADFGEVSRVECHVFSDACKDAIGHVGYLEALARTVLCTCPSCLAIQR